MSVGDVSSIERGSGARYNDGKPDLSLIPPSLLYYSTTEHGELLKALDDFMFRGSSGLLRDWHFKHMRTHSATCAKVFEYGKCKYAAWNWVKGMNWSVPIACALRHADAYYVGGEELDPESGLPHIGHILCNTTMLLHYLHDYPEGNDLPHKVLAK